MSGVRVTFIPAGWNEKWLKTYFSKHSNGGGAIRDIYFPLLDYQAVVIFEDEQTADNVLSHHRLLKDDGKIPKITRLPYLQVFTNLRAELNPLVSSFLEATDEIRDEIEHIGHVQLNKDKDGHIVSATGSWYELEWMWDRLEEVMSEQLYAQRKVQVNLHLQDFRDRRMKDTNDASKSGNPPSGAYTPEENEIIKKKAAKSKHTKTSNFELAADDRREISEKELENLRISNPQMHQSVTHRGSTRDGGAEEQGPAPVTEDVSWDDDDDVEGPAVDRKEAARSVSVTATLKENAQADRGHEKTRKDKELPDLSMLTANSDDIKLLDFKVGELKVHIYVGMITMVETDVIVNAAMGCLVNGGGVAWAIASNASPDLQKQCDAYVKEHGSLDVSEVMHTCAGGRLNKNVQHVIHAVGPMWSQSLGDRRCMYQLTMTFLNAFTYGNDKLNCSSMSLPLISSGIFGCPVEICAEAFLYAVILFAREHVMSTCRLQEVHLVNNDDQNTALTIVTMRKLLEGGAWRLVDDARCLVQEGMTDPKLSTTARDQRPDDYRTTVHVTTPHSQAPVDRARETASGGGKMVTAGRPQPDVPNTKSTKKK